MRSESKLANQNKKVEDKLPTKKEPENDKKFDKTTSRGVKKEKVVTKKNDSKGMGASFEEDLSTTGHKLPNISRLTQTNRVSAS